VSSMPNWTQTRTSVSMLGFASPSSSRDHTCHAAVGSVHSHGGRRSRFCLSPVAIFAPRSTCA
jgi:hypothetical protein